MEKIISYIKRNKEIFILLAFFFIIKIFVIREFGDKDFEPDGYNHVLYANSLFLDFPHHLSLGLEVWAKPLFTFIYGSLSFLFGDKTLFFYQFCNVIVWSIVTLLVYSIVKSYSKNKYISIIAAIFTGIGFLAFRDSVTALTEPIFACTIISSVFFMQCKNLYLAAFFIGLAPLGRIEGFLFMGVFIIYLFFLILKKIFVHKNINIFKFLICIIFAVTPAFTWNFLGYLKTHQLFYLATNGYPSQEGIYGYGTWFHYINGFFEQDKLLIIFFLVGLVFFLIFTTRRKKITDYLVVSFIYTLLFWIINVYLWENGKYGTAGLMRYFVSIIPIMMILAATGYSNLSKILKFRYSDVIQKISIILLVSLQLIFTLNTMYAKKSYDLQNTYPLPDISWEATGKWVKQNNITCRIYSSEPAPLYYAEKNMLNSSIYFDHLDQNPLSDQMYILDVSWSNLDKQNDIKKNSNIKYITSFGSTSIYIDYSSLDHSNCNLKQ